MKNIYLLVGASGSGKTTIAKHLQDLYGYQTIQSYTTRPARYDGEYGHIFVSQSEFDKITDKVAYTNYNGYEYCVTKEQVDTHDTYVIDPAGVKFLRDTYNGAKNIKVILIDVSEEERIERMAARGDTEADIKKRIITDRVEFACFCDADFCVENHDVEHTTEIIRQYIQLTQA